MAPVIYESLERYKAAKVPGYKPPVSSDPLASLYVEGWMWTGQIVEHDGKPLPYLAKVEGIEVRAAVRKGWRPLRDTSGALAIPAEVRDMLVSFYPPEEMPPVIAALAPAKPEPAKK